MRMISIPASVVLLFSTAFAQDYGAERQWLMEHPEAVQALGSMSREEVGQFLQTYQSLSPDEKAKLREHAADLQALGPAERSWALANPDAVRQLGALSEGEQKKFLDTYKNLSDAEKKKLMENADELGKLSPEERAWALENPDAVRQLGNVPDGDRDKMMDAYRSVSPETQRALRESMGGAR
jgi:hypothetical protein